MPSPISLSAIRTDALARRDRGDLDGARQLLEQAVEGAAMISGEDHPEVLHSGHLLATLHRQAGDLSGARRVLENAMNAGVHRHGEEHPLLLAISFDLGEIADELGNRHEARKHFTKVAGSGPAAGFDQQKVLAAQAWLGPVNVPPTAPPPTAVTPVYQPVQPTPGTAASSPPADPFQVPPREGVQAPPSGHAWQQPTQLQPIQPQPAGPPPAHQPQPIYPAQPAGQPTPAHQTSARPTDQAPEAHPAQPAFQRPPVTYLAGAPSRVERPSMAVPPPTVFTPVPASAPPPAGRNTAMMVMTIMSALVAVVAATVTVYMLVRPDSPGAEITDRGPATELTIVSATGGDVTLSWKDPSGGEALQVIHYLRQGETEGGVNRPISSGVTQQILPGLNSNWDYCFQVLTIYAVDNAQASEKVCTNRKG